MKTIFGAYYNSDTTEGRGRMVLGGLFEVEADALAVMETLPACMGGSGREVRPLKLFESYDDWVDGKKLEARQSALAKLTAEEREALGVDIKTDPNEASDDGRPLESEVVAFKLDSKYGDDMKRWRIGTYEPEEPEREEGGWLDASGSGFGDVEVTRWVRLEKRQ